MSPTNWIGRPPPNFTTTNYDSDNYWDADLRWDGITVIEPTYTSRTIPTTTWGERAPVTNILVMPVLYGGIWHDDLLWQDSLLWSDDSVEGTAWSGRTIP